MSAFQKKHKNVEDYSRYGAHWRLISNGTPGGPFLGNVSGPLYWEEGTLLTPVPSAGATGQAMLNKFDAKSLEGRQVHAKCGKEVF